MRRLKKIKVPQKIKKTFTAAEMEHLRCSASCQRDVAIMQFLYRTAARIGEVVRINRKGIRALLRADLIRLYNKYHDDLGYCLIYVKQSLEEEYKEYHALRGNGVGTNMYKALMALPTEEHQKGEQS